MIAPEVLDALLRAGATAEMIVAAVKADSAIDDARKARQREGNAARQRRYREAHAEDNASNALRDVTGVSNGDKVSLDKETSPGPPKEINSFPCVKRVRGVWHRLPEGWVPRPLPAPIQAKVDLWPPGCVGDELASFRRWAANAEDKNGKGRKLDWDQAWRNWITRRHDERHGQQSASGIGKSQAAYRLATANLDPDEPF